MANKKHLEILKKGVKAWNEWREENPKLKPDLSKINLRNKNLQGANLSSVNLSNSDLWASDLSGTNLKNANLNNAFLGKANFFLANLNKANLKKAILTHADLNEANLRNADLRNANLFMAQLDITDLTNANLSGAIMHGALLIGTNLNKANLTSCKIYGIAAWNVKLEEAIQKDLIITREGEPIITVDNLEVAPFIYLLLHNEKIRRVIDTITTKVVLILGRFTPKRKLVLNAIREELRKYDYIPVMFDFDPSKIKDLIETVKIMANLSRFVIADITCPRIVREELITLVPSLPSVPFKILLHKKSRKPYITFPFIEKYNSVLPVYYYNSLEDLLRNFKERIIKPAEAKVIEIKNIKKY